MSVPSLLTELAGVALTCLVVGRAFWLATKWDDRRDRIVAERLGRIAEDVYWRMFREAEFLLAIRLRGRQIAAEIERFRDDWSRKVEPACEPAAAPALTLVEGRP